MFASSLFTRSQEAPVFYKEYLPYFKGNIFLCLAFEILSRWGRGYNQAYCCTPADMLNEQIDPEYWSLIQNELGVYDLDVLRKFLEPIVCFHANKEALLSSKDIFDGKPFAAFIVGTHIVFFLANHELIRQIFVAAFDRNGPQFLAPWYVES